MKRALRLWPALLVAAAILSQFRAPLLGRVYWFEDIQAYFHPLWTAVARTMRRGDLPSWDLGAWSGQPLLGDPQIGALYPPNWLWLAMPPLRVYTLLVLFHAGLGATGMWRLARARGRSREAAALAALGFGVGAFMVLQTRHAMFVGTAAWLPWILWAIERLTTGRKLEHVAAAAFASAMAILAGGWSMLLFGGALVAVYTLARLLARPAEPRARGERARTALALAAAGIIGVGMTAIQLWPALAHARLSPRALGLSYAEAASYAWPSWRYALTLLVPTLYGDDARGTYHGAPDQWELCGYSIGGFATLFVPLAFAWRARRGERLALAGLCGAALLLARGEGGLLHPLLYRAGLVAAVRCPARALFVWSVAAPLLAADGFDFALDWLRRTPTSLRTRAAAALAVGVPLALALELTVTWRSENPSVALAQTREAPGALTFLRSAGRRGRMVTDVHLGQRFHNAGLLWNFESAVGYSPLPIWRYLHLLFIANHGAPYPHARIANDLSAQGLWRFSSPLVDLLNVVWLIAPSDRPPEGTGWDCVFRGPDGIDVWRNREAFVRGFVVYRAQLAADEPSQARAIAAADFRPDRVAVLEEPLPEVPPPAAGEDPPASTPLHALTRTGSFDLAVEVTAHAPGVLVFAEPWYPGWTVFVDGKPDRLLRVDYALRGVALAPGTHVVTMTFEDEPLFYGAAVSTTALAALIGLTFLARRRRRDAPGA